MSIDNLTIKEIKEIRNLTKPTHDNAHWVLGKNYFIRTVTHHLIGKLVKVTSKELVLIQCSWIPSDGRFHNFIVEGKLDEVEPYHPEDDVIVGRGSLIDAVIWRHELPSKQQ